jgi:hypothetical protein
VLQKLDEVLTKIAALDSRLGTMERGRTDTARELAELRLQVEGLQRDVLALRSPSASTSAKLGMPAGMGTLKIVNDYPSIMTVSINGFLHEVWPNQTREFTVTAKSFSYQVVGVHAFPLLRSVEEGKVHTTRIHPEGR